MAVAAVDHRRQAHRHPRRAELGGGRAGRPVDGGTRVHGGGVGAAGPAETSLLAVVVFVVPFLLPIAAVVYLGFRLRAHIHTPQAAAVV
jgi:hypothetical protein